MLDTHVSPRLKVQLSDYDFEKDIENRLLMAQFSPLDLEVLEEILYSPSKISINKLSIHLEVSIEDLLPILEKLTTTDLLKLEDETIYVDKEVRKYFEFHISRFDNDFKPDMEFLQKLIKKVPIHVLPLWYAIPRTSNNIFHSILEKYLNTPQIFQRHLNEIKAIDPIFSKIIDEVYSSEQFKVPAAILRKKLSLSKEEFEEILLYLELCFSVCLSYTKVGEEWQEVITPFYEWKKHLEFLNEIEVFPIEDKEDIAKVGNSPFSFVRAMTGIIKRANKSPLFSKNDEILSMGSSLYNFSKKEMDQVIKKSVLLKLIKLKDDQIIVLDNAKEFLSYEDKDKAVFVFKHNLNHPLSLSEEEYSLLKNHIHEAEKNLCRILNKEWVLFDDFVDGIINPFSEEKTVALQKEGKAWGYRLQRVGLKEKKLFKALIFEVLFEASIVDIGEYEGKECFCLTEFGKPFFEA